MNTELPGNGRQSLASGLREKVIIGKDLQTLYKYNCSKRLKGYASPV